MKMVYLAVPYSVIGEHTPETKAAIKAERVAAMCEVDAKLMRRGVHTVSPVYKHFMLSYGDLPGDYQYWGDYSRNLLERCDALYVITLGGWEESEGVQDEIKFARELKLQIVYLKPDGAILKTEN